MDNLTIFENLKLTPFWKKIVKINLIFCLIGITTFWFLFFVLINGLANKVNIDKSFYRGFTFSFQILFISYSLSVFVINSNERQQREYRFLWLFLYFLALNLLGVISMLMLMKKQKNENSAMKKQEQTTAEVIIEKPLFCKPDKWFMLWAMYSSIGMMIFIVPIPLSIINLINIKKYWKKEAIAINDLKKITYFSSDITLILASKFAF